MREYPFRLEHLAATLTKDPTNGEEIAGFPDQGDEENAKYWGNIDEESAFVESVNGAPRLSIRATITLRNYIEISVKDKLYNGGNYWEVDGSRWGDNQTILEVHCLRESQ